MIEKEIDCIILGGGCSALSLAMQIIDNDISEFSYLILESRTTYKDDRSWCFWEHRYNNFTNLITKSWKSFSFSTKDRIITHTSNKYFYHYIRSIDFYNKALNEISKTKYINLKLGEEVLRIKSMRDKYYIYTSKDTYIAKKILDTRPKKNIYSTSPFLLQSFMGYEIEIEGNYKSYKTAKIMSNMRIHNNNFVFDYILPITKNRLLVEATLFTKKPVSKRILKKYLYETLTHQRLTNYKILRKEFGVIPMGFIKKNIYKENKSYFYAGGVAGAIRPSSGYAFLRIQDWAKDCAFNLKNKGELISHPKESFFLYYMDRKLLKILEKNINLAPVIFFIFLKRISTISFIRFMIGRAKFYDYIKVICSMPKKIFLNQ